MLTTVWIFFYVCSTSSCVSEFTWLVRYEGVTQAIVCSSLAPCRFWVHFLGGRLGTWEWDGNPVSWKKERQVLALLLGLFAVAVTEVQKTTLADTSNIMAKALPGSMCSWPAVVAGWNLFSFWTQKVGLLFAWPKKSQVYWYAYLLIEKSVWLWRLSTLLFLAPLGKASILRRSINLFSFRWNIVYFKCISNILLTSIHVQDYSLCRKREVQKAHLSNATVIIEQ